MRASWIPSACPRSRLPASCSRRGSKDSDASPTTSTGRGIPGPAACSTGSTGAAWNRYRNPIPVISGPTDWSRLLDDAKFLAEYHDVLAEFDEYMANGSDHWFQRRYAERLRGPIAYFCAEYGFHESLGIYSGGLGVLAGDHMKSASDMALPAIGVGLLYRKGYFRQTIDADGHQEHDYPDYDLGRLPLGRVQDASGLPLTVTVELPGRDLFVAVWVAQVGRVPVLLLDTDMPENADADRPITNILYVRGREMRLHQELVLGIGGVRAIRALGLSPAVWHLNEGHSAFLLAERAREHVAAGMSLDDAWHDVRHDSVFTIHTPVSAGNERFDSDLVRRVAGPLLEEGGIPVDELLELGLAVDGDQTQFDMTAFSLRLTRGANAVSQLHAKTANETWQGIIDHPILGITNGIHGPTWIGSPIAEPARGPGRRPRRSRRQHPARPVLGADRPDPRPQPVGGAPAPEARARPLRARPSAQPVRPPRRGAERPGRARDGARPGRPDDRLRPPVRDLQARRPALHRHRPAGRDAVGRGPADPGRLRRQGPPGRPARPARHPGDLPALAVDPAARPRVHPRGLRHAGRPLPRPGRRRLAQQPAPPARGVRHVRHEGGPERRPQRQRPRRLVGRGLRGATTAGRSAAARPTRTRPPRTGATPRTSTGSSRRRSSRPTTSATAHGLPTRWLAVMRRAMASALWQFSTTRMLHEYTERLYLPAAGVPVEAVPAPAVTEAG